MTENNVKINGLTVKKVTLNTAIIGSGAAGYNAALRLTDYGVDDIALNIREICPNAVRSEMLFCVAFQSYRLGCDGI